MTESFRDLFEAVYHAHHASLFRYLDRLSGDPDLAADIAQEAFIRLCRRGSLPDQPDRWLITVALNLFRNEWTTSKRHRDLKERRAPELSISSPPSPLEATDASQRRARVRKALDQLSQRDRELLLLRAEGYSYRDLAATLDLNNGSVGTFLARAKRAFQVAYEEL